MMPDLQRMGGPTEFLKAGHLCEAFHIPCSAHLFPEMSLPLLASLPGVAVIWNTCRGIRGDLSGSDRN